MGKVDTALAVGPDLLLYYLLSQFPAFRSLCMLQAQLPVPSRQHLTMMCWGGHLRHQGHLGQQV